MLNAAVRPDTYAEIMLACCRNPFHVTSCGVLCSSGICGQTALSGAVESHTADNSLFLSPAKNSALPARGRDRASISDDFGATSLETTRSAERRPASQKPSNG